MSVTWLCDVSIDFVDAVLKAHGRVDVQVIDGLLPRPAKRVNAGVEHQTERSNKVVRVIANQLYRKDKVFNCKI